MRYLKLTDIKHATRAGFHNPCGFVTDQIGKQAQRRAARHKNYGIIQYRGGIFRHNAQKRIFIIPIVLDEKKYTILINHMPWLYQYPKAPFHRSLRN